MKTTKMLTIYVLALGLMVCSARICEATPMGTAFTYQGHLYDANHVANGLYDFEFELYDALSDGNQLGSTIEVNDLDVIDAYFTVGLDFGSSVFDGNSVWLEIDVRPGDSNDPNAFVSLSPRQEVTPVPYALQTRGLFVDNTGNVGIGTTTPAATLDVAGNVRIGGDIKLTDTDSQVKFAHTFSAYLINVENSADTGIYYNAANNYWEWRGSGIQRGFIDLDNGDVTVAGRLGIGTTGPDRNLDIYHSNSGGGIEIDRTANTIWSGIVYENAGAENWFIGVQSDSNNLLFRDDGARNAIVIEDGTGNVGIGTNNPGEKLEVAGNAHVEGDLTWKTRTGYLSIAAADFRPQCDGYDFVNGLMLINNDDGSDYYYAGVHLPHGVTVTRMTFYWSDTSPAIGSTFFHRSTLTGSFNSIATAATTGSGGNGSSYDDTISYATIDNSQYAYYMQWYLPDHDVQGYGVVIEYTYTEPH